MQKYFDIDFYPFPRHLLGRYPTEKQLSRVHEAGKNRIIGPRHVADFYAVSVFDDDGFSVIGIVRLAKEIQFVADGKVRLQLFDPLDMAGSGDVRAEKENIPLKRFRDIQSAALPMEKADQAAAVVFDQFIHVHSPRHVCDFFVVCSKNFLQLFYLPLQLGFSGVDFLRVLDKCLHGVGKL